jgi:hypothetical protein
MVEKLRALIWTLALAYHLRRANWAKSFFSAYSWAADDCWQDYRLDEFTPKEALLEDASYG